MADDKSKNSVAEPLKQVNDPKIDAIKQLIFGDNMVEYDERFDKLVAKLEKTQADLESKLAAQNQSLKDDIKALNDEMTKNITALEKSTSKEMTRLDDVKTNRKALGKMLQNIGEKLMQ